MATLHVLINTHPELKWKQVYTCHICMLQTWHWSVKNRMSPHVCAQAWTLRPMGPMLLLWRQGRTKEHLSSPWRYVVKKSAWQTGQNGVCVCVDRLKRRKTSITIKLNFAGGSREFTVLLPTKTAVNTPWSRLRRQSVYLRWNIGL